MVCVEYTERIQACDSWSITHVVFLSGWWNYTLNDCSYWVPPVTEAPSLASAQLATPAPVDKAPLALAAGAGAIVALAIGAVILKLRGRRSEGYSTIPS